MKIGNVTMQSRIPRIHAWTGTAGLSQIDISRHCIAFSCRKDVASHMGQFSLTLIPSVTHDQRTVAISERISLPWLFRLLEPNTPVSIGFDVSGGIMLGLVRSRDYTHVAVNGQVTVGLVVSGLDFGVALNDELIYMAVTTAYQQRWEAAIKSVLGEDHPILRDVLEPLGVVRKGADGRPDDPAPTLENASVKEIVDLIVHNVATMRIPILKDTFGGDGSIAGTLDAETYVSSYQNDRVYCSSLFRQESTVIGFINSILDKDFYELRLDSYPRSGSAIPQPCLIIRPKPFDEATQRSPEWPSVTIEDGIGWNALATFVNAREHHEIRPDSVLNMQIGTSSDEAFDYYVVVNNNEVGATDMDVQAGRINPLLDLFMAQRFGNRRYESHRAMTNGNPYKMDESGGKDVTEWDAIRSGAIESRSRLFRWYRGNPWFLNGRVTVIGKDEYRAGDPVFLPMLEDVLSGEKGVRFYASSVTHEWSLGGAYTCTLGIQRGHGSGFHAALVNMIREVMPDSVPYGWTSVPEEGT